MTGAQAHCRSPRQANANPALPSRHQMSSTPCNPPTTGQDPPSARDSCGFGSEQGQIRNPGIGGEVLHPITPRLELQSSILSLVASHLLRARSFRPIAGKRVEPPPRPEIRLYTFPVACAGVRSESRMLWELVIALGSRGVPRSSRAPPGSPAGVEALAWPGDGFWGGWSIAAGARVGHYRPFT